MGTRKPVPDHEQCDTQRVPVGDNYLAPDQSTSDIQPDAVGGDPFTSDHFRPNIHVPDVRGRTTSDQSPRDTQGAVVGSDGSVVDQMRIDDHSSDVDGGARKLAPDHRRGDIQLPFVGGNPFTSDQTSSDTQGSGVRGTTSDQARDDDQRTRVGSNNGSAVDQRTSDSNGRSVDGGASNLVSDHSPRDAHDRSVGDDRPAADHRPSDTYSPCVGGGTTYSDLLLWSESLSDLETIRISLENRIRSAEDEKISVDGNLYVLLLGQDADLLIAAGGMRAEDGKVYRNLAKKAKSGVKGEENYATKQLEIALSKHPLGPWVEAQKGVGLKQAGRLLGVIGDPYVRGPEFGEDGEEIAPARPRRGPAELFAYCGFHTVSVGNQVASDTQGHRVPGENGNSPSLTKPRTTPKSSSSAAGRVAPRRQRGVQANWNEAARMRVRLIAESCIKTNGPLREVYDRGKAKYADAVHDHPCVRCGPSGKPAPAGSPLSLGHQHARALRLVGKEVLKGLYNESKRLHRLGEDGAS